MRKMNQITQEAKRLFRLCFVEDHIDENRVRLVIKRVMQIRRSECLLLLRQLEQRLKHEYKIHTAEIASASLLSEMFKRRLQDDLAVAYGSGLKFVFQHDPALIGGVRVQIGSDVYDGTVRSRLAALGKSFGIKSESATKP